MISLPSLPPPYVIHSLLVSSVRVISHTFALLCHHSNDNRYSDCTTIDPLIHPLTPPHTYTL